VKALKADVAVVLAYGRILTKDLLEAPRLGCVNVHASLLPRWRGAAPIQAAILAGDVETGVCTQQMEEGLDTGPLYVQESMTLEQHETAGSLHDKLMMMSAQVAVQTLATMESTTPIPQSEKGVCWAPKISKNDGRVEWSRSATELDRRIRAMSPWPGGWVDYGEGRLKIIAASPSKECGQAGTVLSVSPDLIVACSEGALVLQRVQASGRKPVLGREFANGARLAVHQEF
jgi:methionyl-tRNA formyltransferase